MRRQFLILIACAALVGCTLNTPDAPNAPADPPDVIAESVSADVMIAQIPTDIPAPTAEPTPTIDPAVILQVADRHLLNGYYEAAVQTYQTLLRETNAPAEQRAAAAFGLGQAAVREGLFAQAFEALTPFLDEFPNDARRAQAHFLRGDAHLGLAEWDKALVDFRAYLELRPGLIDSYAHERMGDAYFALGQSNEALASYSAAISATRVLVPQVALRERVAQVFVNAGLAEQAVAQYDAILEAAQNYTYRALIAYRAAEAVLRYDEQNGLVRLNRVFLDFIDRPEAYDAMQTLIERGVSLPAYQRGRAAYFYGDYPTALDAFNEFALNTPAADIPAEMYLFMGRAYREIGNQPAALTAFQTIVQQYPTDPLFGEALLEQGRTRFLADDIPAAIDHYLSIGENYSYLEQAAEAIWRAGYLYSTNDQPEQARVVFEQLAEAFPNSAQARSGLFIAAAAAYNANQLGVAETFYARLATISTGEEQASAYFWLGRVAQQRNNQPVAQQAYAQAISAAPDSYFAARATDINSGVPPFTPPAAYQFQFDDTAELIAAENWLRATYGIEQEGALWQLAPELANDPRLLRGAELWALAAYDEANSEFGGLVSEMETNALASYQLAIYLRGIGAYYQSIFAASYVIRLANVGTLDAPPYIARMRYPAYYLDVMQDMSARRNVDPLLMYALIRHESLFNTYATAAADEKGLTQVVPPTAQYIAEQLQWANYQHSDLFRPHAGIEFGGFYLQEQLRLFDGNVIPSLAAYNAGPGRAIDWNRLSGGDPDQFMSAITIDSTRLYVERIYSHYNIYRVLYGA